MILLAHQFAGLERWIGDLEDRDAVDEGIDPASDCARKTMSSPTAAVSLISMRFLPSRSVAGEVGGGDRRGPCDSCVPSPPLSPQEARPRGKAVQSAVMRPMRMRLYMDR